MNYASALSLWVNAAKTQIVCKMIGCCRRKDKASPVDYVTKPSTLKLAPVCMYLDTQHQEQRKHTGVATVDVCPRYISHTCRDTWSWPSSSSTPAVLITSTHTPASPSPSRRHPSAPATNSRHEAAQAIVNADARTMLWRGTAAGEVRKIVCGERRWVREKELRSEEQPRKSLGPKLEFRLFFAKVETQNLVLMPSGMNCHKKQAQLRRFIPRQVSLSSKPLSLRPRDDEAHTLHPNSCPLAEQDKQLPVPASHHASWSAANRMHHEYQQSSDPVQLTYAGFTSGKNMV